MAGNRQPPPQTIIGLRPSGPDRRRPGSNAGLAAGAARHRWEMSLRLPRDHYVRLDSNDYSVHPSAVGRRVLVRADADRVRVWCDGGLVADHERVWAKHQTVSDVAHVRAAQLLRQQRFTLIPPAAETEVEQRSLIDYDTALGVAGFDGGVAL